METNMEKTNAEPMRKRKSHQELGKIYFWTATIRNWYCVMETDARKKIILDGFNWLHKNELITIFGFVIMPNHIHVIWRQEKRNGQEMPLASFMKFTSLRILSEVSNMGLLPLMRVNYCNKNHEIWKRDSLAVELYSRPVMMQKLNYIHVNPVKGKWKLSSDSVSYPFSSASFYETHKDPFGFLSNIFDEIEG